MNGDSAFNFASLEHIHVQVVACDNGATIPDGVKNCSESPQVFNYQIPDISPPQGFMGVLAPLTSPDEGKIEVVWHAPTAWSDYRGFRIYTIPNDAVQPYKVSDLKFLTLCECALPGCTDALTSCMVAGLGARSTYRIHVRAYDAANNLTTYVSPATSFVAVTTKDTTPPRFTGGLTLTYNESQIHAEWDEAFDNQDPLEVGAHISYELWRRTGTQFTDPAQPFVDGQRIGTIATLTEFFDANLESNITYFYSVCALDAAGNRTCQDPSAVKQITTPDVVPPTISNVSSTKLDDQNLKIWDLTFEVEDNTLPADVSVNVYRYISVDETQPPASQFTDIITSGDGTLAKLENLSGPANQNRYIHYLIEARDQVGLKAQRFLTIHSENEISVTSITRPHALAGTKRLVTFLGNGFAKSMTIAFRTSAGVIIPCDRSDVFTAQRAACSTPLLSHGTYDLIFTNPADTGATTLLQAYKALSEEEALEIGDVCDTPTWNTTIGLPGESQNFICTPDQLSRTRDMANRILFLGDNIDLHGLTFHPMHTMTCYAGMTAPAYCNRLDGQSPYGDSYSIANWTYHATTESIGLFGRSFYTAAIANFNLVGFNLSSETYSISPLSHQTTSNACGGNISNIFVQAKIINNSPTIMTYTGGLVGSSSHVINNVHTDIEIVSASTNDGSRAGDIVGTTNCTISNSSARGKLTSANSFIGGVVGLSGATLSKNTAYMNLILQGSNGRVGGIAGQCGGFLNEENVFVGKIKSDTGAAGICYSYISATNAEIKGNRVTADIEATSNVASGIIGFTYPYDGMVITNNHFTGRVKSQSTSASGILGRMQSSTSALGPMTLSHNTVKDAHIEELQQVGGVVGTVENCYQNNYCINGVTVSNNLVTGTKIVGYQQSTGGIVGSSNSGRDRFFITGNVFKGSVSGQIYVGGVAGYLGGTAYDNYAMFDKSAINDKITGAQYVGGAFGFLDARAESSSTIFGAEIGRNYAAIKVEAPAGRGGLVGSVREQGGEVAVYTDSNYWDIDISGSTTSAGSSNYVFGRTSNLMKLMSNYINWNFSITNGTWSYTPGMYPRLRWETK